MYWHFVVASWDNKNSSMSTEMCAFLVRYGYVFADSLVFAHLIMKCTTLSSLNSSTGLILKCYKPTSCVVVIQPVVSKPNWQFVNAVMDLSSLLLRLKY